MKLQGIEHYSCNPIPRLVNTISAAETFQLHLKPGFNLLGPRNKADFTAIGCSVSYLSDYTKYSRFRVRRSLALYCYCYTTLKVLKVFY